MRLSTQSLTKRLANNKGQSFFSKLALPPILILASLAGASFSLSLAPYGYWFVALISPAILYALLLSDMSNKRAFIIGEAYGFGFWLVGASWLYSSLYNYGEVPMPLAMLAIVIMALLMGLFHALMAVIFNRFMGKQPFAFAGLWVLFEWSKTWVLTGFPWLFVGYAFTEQYWLSSLAPVFGVFAISFVAVLLSASLVETVRRRAGFLLLSSFFVLASVSLWLINPQWTQKKQDDTLSVSLLQGNIPQDLKWLTEYQTETLEIYAKLTSSEWEQDVIVWPEASIPMFQTQVTDFIAQVASFAEQTDTAWITGVPFKDDAKFEPMTQPYPPFYNSVIAMGTDSAGQYNKQRLVPFGEYIPLKGLLNLFPNLANNDDVLDYTKGSDQQTLITVRNHKMGTAICYEVAYPETTRKNSIGSDFMLTISNDAWFDGTALPHQHLQMVQMRSLETGRWFMRATNTGITAFINEKGQIVKQLPQLERAVLRGEVELRQGQTPFVSFGQYPMMAFISALLLLSYLGQRAKLKAQYGRDQKIYTDINQLNQHIEATKHTVERVFIEKTPVTTKDIEQNNAKTETDNKLESKLDIKAESKIESKKTTHTEKNQGIEPSSNTIKELDRTNNISGSNDVTSNLNNHKSSDKIDEKSSVRVANNTSTANTDSLKTLSAPAETSDGKHNQLTVAKNTVNPLENPIVNKTANIDTYNITDGVTNNDKTSNDSQKQADLNAVATQLKIAHQNQQKNAKTSVENDVTKQPAAKSSINTSQDQQAQSIAAKAKRAKANERLVADKLKNTHALQKTDLVQQEATANNRPLERKPFNPEALTEKLAAHTDSTTNTPVTTSTEQPVTQPDSDKSRLIDDLKNHQSRINELIARRTAREKLLQAQLRNQQDTAITKQRLERQRLQDSDDKPKNEAEN